MDRTFFERDPLDVAPDLLGFEFRSIVGGVTTGGRIVEVEAYSGADDPGSHGHRGPTPRTRVMFGAPGHLYVYFSYGMHWCTNIVCGPEGSCGAVLLRALAPSSGVDHMYRRRPAARRERDLCSGPAKLSGALGIDGELDGLDLFSRDGPIVVAPGATPVGQVCSSPRIGLAPDRGASLQWRWYVPGDPNVSARPR